MGRSQRTQRSPGGRLAARRRLDASRRLLMALIATALLSGAVFSVPAWAANKAPAVTKQPVSKTVEEGQSATFESTASGTPAPTVQWELSTDGGASWTQIEGATANQLIIASANTAESGYQFRANFKNVAGEATSKAATLTVRKAPVVTKQPANTTVEEGQTATFEATASGFPTGAAVWSSSS